jgi:phospholipid/cholesterol/gamma-HCH transport system permease protein
MRGITRPASIDRDFVEAVLQFEAEDQGGRRRVRLSGRWTVEEAAALEPRLQKAAAGMAGDVDFDAAGIEAMDLTGAWLLRSLERRLKDAGCRVEWAGGRPAQLEFIDSTEAGDGGKALPASDGPDGVRRVLYALGLRAVLAKEGALDVLGFVGAVTAGYGRVFGSLRRLRIPSIVRHVYETGLTAVPIVALIAFLISVIIAYIGAQQLRKFGGEIFVVDLVTVSVLRELGVLLTAIIVAGRSGSAFAAEIGAMKLNDEVDALRAIGMDPVEVLVLPRIFGLVIALPVLTVVADAMGLAGGALLSWYLVDIPLGQYIERVQGAIAETTFWVGIIKAPVFAVLIALVGTMRGMQVQTSSRELGRLTTMAVVQSIFLVILADAVFAVIFMELDI